MARTSVACLTLLFAAEIVASKSAAGKRPLILQKSGGLQGNFAYLAIAPTRGVAAFFVLNTFSLAGFPAAVAATNDLIGELAPR
jgi:D-alanyl-D-alanine-carboxypeptidase/D-alanyl-D-alanine-endopeptidase